jgi:hypothetical protein
MIIPLNNSISSSIFDYDALEFISVCGITNSLVTRRINDCFKELKSADIWDRIYYGFAMVYSGTTQSMLVDIKSRILLDITTPTVGLTSSPTYSVTGIEYNGGVFHSVLGLPFSFIENDNAAPGHISIYNRKDYNSLGLTAFSKHGFQELSGYEQSISFSTFGVSASLWNISGPMSFTLSNTSGFFLFSTTDDNSGLPSSISNPYQFYLSRNGVLIGSQSSTGNYHTYGSNIFVGAFGSSPFSPTIRSIDEICWYSIGSGFGSDSPSGRQIDLSQQKKYFEIIQNLQTALEREKDT